MEKSRVVVAVCAVFEFTEVDIRSDDLVCCVFTSGVKSDAGCVAEMILTTGELPLEWLVLDNFETPPNFDTFFKKKRDVI